MPLGPPAIEKCPHGDGPIAVQPRAHQFLAARRPQPLLVRLNVNVLVVVDPRRDEHPFQPSQRVADDAVAQGGGINVTLAHPLMPWAARVSRGTQTDWHAAMDSMRSSMVNLWLRQSLESRGRCAGVVRHWC